MLDEIEKDARASSAPAEAKKEKGPPITRLEAAVEEKAMEVLFKDHLAEFEAREKELLAEQKVPHRQKG